jgi:hypothetical protein
MSTVNNGPQIVRSGLILDLDASYMRSYSPNVLPNPTDIFAWCGSAGTNLCTISRDTSITRQYGSIPLKMVISGNDPYIASYNSPTWNLSAAATGQTWTVSVYVKASVATNVEGPVIFECNSSGTYLVATSAGSISVTTSWTRISYSRTFSNASTAYIQTRLVGTPTGGSGITIWWDGLQVERASAATNFNPYYFGNTSWRDVSSSGNIFNSTLYTYPSFVQSGSQSYFSFINNGTIQNNIYCYSTGLVTATSTQTQYTRLGWFYLTSYSDGWSPIFQNVIGNNSDMGLTVYSNGTIHFRQYTNSITGGTASQDYGVSSDGTVLINRWNFAAIVVNRTGNQVSFYINGNFVIGNNGGSQGPYGIQIGGLATEHSIGQFSFLQFYNRVLSASEILQNYNALKGRFNL